MTIEDFLRMLLRNALLLIAVTVLGAAAGYGYSHTQPALYSASAPGYVANGNVTPTEETGSEEGHAIANDAVEAVAIETGGDEGVTAGYSLVTYQTALLPTAPVSPDRQRFAMLGAAAGLLLALALALAFLRDRNDTRVCKLRTNLRYIDADLRLPVVATEFGVDGEVGVSQLLVGSRQMKELVAELSTEYFVIVDAPSVLAVTDSQLLTRHADGAILGAVPGATRTLSVERAIETLRSVGAKVYGAVLIRASTSRFTRIAYGDDEYGDGAYGRYGGRYRYSGNYAKLVAPVEGDDVDATKAGGVADAHGARPATGTPAPEEDGGRRRRAADPQEPR